MSGGPSSMEHLISGAAKGGWDWFEEADEKIKDRLTLDQKRSEEDANAVARAWAEFSDTPGGKKALDALFDVTLRRTVYFASLGLDIQSMAVFGAFREGQNAVAQEIARQIAKGRGETTKPRDVT